MDSAALDALDELRDIHAPEPVSWWPPAPGWWIVLGLVLLATLIGLGLRYWRKKNALRESALAELAHIKTEFSESQDAVQLAARLSILLRRVAISGGDRKKAALKGRAWLAYLDETGQTRAFSEGAGQVLISAPYQSSAELDADALLAAVEAWLQTSRAGR
ncbi:MAG TPA: DUF4381 domain-containing protein [Candidatus Tenderia sp.]|nr:DUF4381 domain-containing protein [Candidatus Tenderia sp.]